MGSRARSGTSWWERVQGRREALGQPAPNDWMAVIDQHHRMVQALAVVTPVTSADRRGEPTRG